MVSAWSSHTLPTTAFAVDARDLTGIVLHAREACELLVKHIDLVG
jgi:hypothetical protein